MTVRPLTGIALKSCIDTLRPWISQSTVLDLYAGEGRFGRACLAEGAALVTFVENDHRQIERLQKITQARVVIADALQYLRSTTDTFDIIFADPPFPLWTESLWKNLSRGAHSRLRSQAIFLVKGPKRVLFSRPLGYSEKKTTCFGESRLTYWIKTDDH